MTNQKFDIRRIVTVDGFVRDEDISRAVEKLARLQGGEYVRRLVYELDGVKSFRVGIAHNNPARNIVVRAGELLEKDFLPSSKYARKVYQFYGKDGVNFGIGSYDWGRKSNIIQIDQESTTRRFVERCGDELQQIINEEILRVK